MKLKTETWMGSFPGKVFDHLVTFDWDDYDKRDEDNDVTVTMMTMTMMATRAMTVMVMVTTTMTMRMKVTIAMMMAKMMMVMMMVMVLVHLQRQSFVGSRLQRSAPFFSSSQTETARYQSRFLFVRCCL